MPDLTAQEMASKLQAERFTHEGPAAQGLTDPIVDTPMVVTLDQLRPYELNPRKTRNPRYDDIKASIRERKLDAPPPITRRPGEPYYIIRNGGNTRLEILNELWAETKDEAFFRICCLFRPWTADGEILALTGHLAENELRGNLTFIERALGIQTARELCQKNEEKPLTQMELARQLTARGFPITQSHISRLQDAVRYLLPAIPTLLFDGLGKPQIERLIALRKAALRSWERHARGEPLPLDFSSFFQETLAIFDAEGDAFDVQRVQDEMIGQMARLLAVDYDALALEMIDPQFRHHAPAPPPLARAEPSTGQAATAPIKIDAIPVAPSPARATSTAPDDGSRTERKPKHLMPAASEQDDTEPNTQYNDRLDGHIVSPAQTTERLQSIQRTIAAATGDPVEDFEGNVVHAIPVQAGGLHPISDVWYIEPALDAPERLRTHIAQLATEIAAEAEVAECVEAIDDGIGFVCIRPASLSSNGTSTIFVRAVLSLLSTLSAEYAPTRRASIDAVRLADDLAPLLQGRFAARRLTSNTTRLSDAGLVKLFRLIRLARRIVELQSHVQQSANPALDA